MNRAERLLNLLQILRSYRYPVRGQKLAERLNISIRTLYRDISTLQSQGAEIEGEPGIGYVLKAGFFIPPLMFSQAEVEALMLGMLWVSNFGDRSLSKAAVSAINKIREVLPEKIKSEVSHVSLRVGPPQTGELEQEDLSTLREAVRQERKVKIVYKSKRNSEELVVWPIAIGYFTDGRILVGWCQEQRNFRHFRTLGIESMIILDEKLPLKRESIFHKWQSEQFKKLGIHPGAKNFRTTRSMK
jgi:predicted DNA-binding transcriptional regulator YafY